MAILRRAAAGAVVAVSCGGPQHAQPPADPAPEVKIYAPMGMKADSKAPHQAVILGTDDHNGSTVVRLPVIASNALVDAMFVKLGGTAPASGGMTPVKLATGPNAEGSVQVGIYEEFAGGTGAQWRAGVWVSALVAATALNKDLTDFTFSASSGGYIDGASASGLMAGGFLAAMTGAAIDPKVTMTGTINPDGTFGPVGGIPEKFLGSIEKGKTKLGYPIGMRYAKSEVSGKPVDLVELAKAHGAEAIEIADIHEAYKLLTGKRLPEAVPVSEADMALDAQTIKALDDKYQEWQQRLATDWGAVVELESAGKLPKTLSLVRRYAQDNVDAAEKLHKRGMIAAAYSKMLAAWAYTSGTATTFQMLTKVRAGNITGAIAQLDALDAVDETAAVFKKIGALRPTTLGGHLVMLSAFQAALRGWGFHVFAHAAIVRSKAYLESLTGKDAGELGSAAIAEELVNTIAPTVLYVDRTVASTVLATQELDFELENSVTYVCSIPNVLKMSASFQSASIAGLNYFDTLLVEPFAQASHVTTDEAREQIALIEPDYLVAFMTSKLGDAEGLPQELKTAWGEHSLAWGLMSLAGNELAYFNSAQLVAKYYSLVIHTDAAGKISSIDHDKAFTNMLASAERSARASARAARIATGAIPVQAKLAYQLASVEREGELTDKIDALSEFWAASAFSQTAVMLARN
ncbi:MAG: peptidase lon domain protein [Myxococcales bacterium]|nr:peptidase lon domain protein [Myxococcales bacterium]